MPETTRKTGVIHGFGVSNLAATAQQLESKVVLVLLADVLVEEQGGHAGPNDGAANSAHADHVQEGLLAEIARRSRPS